MTLFRSLVVATVTALVLAPAGAAPKKTDIVIEPGPAQMTEAERALAPDPAGGAEHAIILSLDVERDDRRGTGYEKGVHLRAKIHSNEGRGLADVEIPITDTGKLKQWWGRTILPDGTVLELAESDLKRQTAARAEGREASVLKAALPGVVPGAVIDYGYVLLDDGMPWIETVDLQRPWKVERLRYRWRASDWLQAAYRPKRLDGLTADIQKDREAILVTAERIPPMKEEPHMPPPDESRASVTLYYIAPYTSYDRFWEDLGRRVDVGLKRFLGRDKPLREIVASLPEGPLEKRLEAAYDWVEANIKREGLLSAEEVESGSSEKEEDARSNVTTLLEKKAGSFYEVAALYIGLARLLGAEAYLVFAPDRTERYWDPNLRSTYSFDYLLVAVQPPAEGEGKTIFADPGSGLPFGEVPWWIAGVPAMLCTPKGGKPATIPLSDMRKNTIEARANVSFTRDLDTQRGLWTRVAKGQSAYASRHSLRRTAPDERQERIDGYCGAGTEFEVREANAADLDRLGGELKIRCDASREGLGIDPEVDRLQVAFGGPWISALPELGAAPERQFPVVFDYPWVAVEEVIVNAPPGYEPEGTPFEPVRVDSPYGRYQLRVDVSETAYRIQRMVVLGAVIVQVPEVPKLRAFLDDARRHDRTPLVFQRKSGS